MATRSSRAIAGSTAAARRPKAKPVKSTRRSTAEIRSLILQSARDLFAQGGYGNTSTRAIAERAGVLEHLIFRHFGSKAALFEEAVFLPSSELFESYNRSFQTRVPEEKNMEARARSYLEALYDQLTRDRSLWRALILAFQTEENGDLAHLLQEGDSPLIKYLDDLSQSTGQSLKEMGWSHVDPRIATRITFGYVFALALFGDLLYSKKNRPTRESLIDEMTAYMLHGVGHRAKGG